MRPSTLLAALLAGACAPGPDASPPQRRNLLLVTLDTTRADRIGCYGRGLDTTPHLDRLAAEGVLFEQCLATASVTPVSHASILTGLYPYQHGLRVLSGAGGDRLPDDVPLLPELLACEGWATGAFVSSFPISARFGMDRGFEVYDSGLLTAEDDPDAARPGSPEGRDHGETQRRADLTTTKALRWLARQDEPFFLWVHWFDPHDPTLVPPRSLIDAYQPARYRPPPGVAPPTLYDVEVRWMDEQLGRLLDALAARGALERTLVVVTADHGEGLGDHGWDSHRLLYQEQVRVPLVLKLPGGPAGRRVPDLVSTVDLLPTVLDELGLPAPAGVAGRSLAPLVRGGELPPRPVYADQLNLWDHNAGILRKRPRDDLLFCVVDPPWKLIYRALRPDESELYHLGDDPRELVNRWTERPDVAARLVRDLEAREGALRLEPFGAGDPDPAELEILRQLGYVADDER